MSPCFQETYNAQSYHSNSEDDGASQIRINQYLIMQEIGRGSFGAVHLATDQYGKEFVRSHHRICVKGPEPFEIAGNGLLSR